MPLRHPERLLQHAPFLFHDRPRESPNAYALFFPAAVLFPVMLSRCWIIVGVYCSAGYSVSVYVGRKGVVYCCPYAHVRWWLPDVRVN